ncbi:MAG: Na-translocating system protein MpsC family protein [Solirubrobacteraceae bacterium]
MTEPDLDPADVAAMRASAGHGGPLRQELSNAIVALFKEYYGRGPADCRTYLEPDLVVVVMTGGYHAAEQTLFEAGKWHEVRSARMSWQDTMEVRFIETIEGLTRRQVKAFMSANHQSPDVTVEMFLLERADSASLAKR